MPSINEITKEKIRGYLEATIEATIEDKTRRRELRFKNPQTYLQLQSRQPKLKPFHSALIPSELVPFLSFERNLNARLGSAMEQCAYYIALDHHAEAHRNHSFSGYVTNNAIREIEKQSLRFHQARDENNALPSLDEMIHSVLNAQDNGEKILKVVQADLYIHTHNGMEYYFNFRSPQPNKNQCYSMIYQILYHHLIRGLPRPQVQSYAAMAYNPYGNSRQDYKWSVARMYLPFEQATVIGDEFWRFIGGETTYLELLEIYAEVGRDKNKRILESLI